MTNKRGSILALCDRVGRASVEILLYLAAALLIVLITHQIRMWE